VSRPLPSWKRSILTEIYLCHACFCQEILRTETAGQATAACDSFKASLRALLLAPPWRAPAAGRCCDSLISMSTHWRGHFDWKFTYVTRVLVTETRAQRPPPLVGSKEVL
jgi:hypothetical protein